MTKSKSSTIAIVALSVLLAAALAATIVLAAFNASRQATTTITFANGVKIDVTGITKTVESENPAFNQYYWNYTKTTGTDETKGQIVNATTKVTLQDIIIKSGDANEVYVIVKPVITQTRSEGSTVNNDVTNTEAFYASAPAGWTAIMTTEQTPKATGWYIYGAISGDKPVDNTDGKKATFPGKVITATSDAAYSAVVNIYAVSAAEGANGLDDILNFARTNAAVTA